MRVSSAAFIVGTRESPRLYTRWPKPMILRFSESARSSQGTTLSASPISSKMCSTASFAPPCSGPLSAPIAPTTAEYRSLRVDVTTRAVNVDALKECSAYRIIERLNASTTTGSASAPNVIQRKLAA